MYESKARYKLFEQKLHMMLGASPPHCSFIRQMPTELLLYCSLYIGILDVIYFCLR